MASAPHNPRASLLAGLRTGGVRSTSTAIPHTAAPGASFNITRFASHHHAAPLYEDDEDQLIDLPQHPSFNSHYAAVRQLPVTAAVDGHNNSFATQQVGQRGLNPNSIPFSPAFNPNAPPSNANQLQNQALQMQMLQLEMLRIQQAQQLQAEMMAQAQRQLQQSQMQSQVTDRRTSIGYNNLPSTAGPTTYSFDPRTTAINPQMRRANHAELLRSQLGVAGVDEVPMTAALGGKFGSRITSLNAAGRLDDATLAPQAVNSTTVISGGTSLGNPNLNNVSKVASNPASKSDSVSSWRRGGNNNSVLSGNNRVASSPSVKVTPPPETLTESPSLPSKFRPQPLRFSGATTQPLPIVTIDTSDINDNDDASSTSSASNSDPDTPRSSSSSGTSLSPREEASKKLYEGLGIGRPASSASDQQHDPQVAYIPSVAVHRMASQPVRQPRGPPSGAEELGPKNFATRIRRQAIDGLGALMDARERRELVEAF